jgi:LacI family transcriptional regulator
VKRNGVAAPTILDVAAAANVSRATAARALGGYGPVSEEVRERVAAAAASLGYRPNNVARSMKSGSTRTIGVVLGDIRLPFFAGALAGVADVAQAEGWEPVLANTNEDLEREKRAVAVLYEKRVDGLIVAPASSDDGAHLVDLARRGLPLVLLDRQVRDVPADAVVVDNERAAARAVQHLVGLGHERIAMIASTGPGRRLDSGSRTFDLGALTGTDTDPPLKPSVARVRGYLWGLRDAGLTADARLVRHADYDRESAASQAVAVLEMRDRPTAIITSDSLMTLGVLAAVRHVGVRMPDDLSLIGFDDADWATVAVPSITVVAQPVLELGAVAVRRLLARIGGDERPPQVVVLKTELVLRESTGPAPTHMHRS